MSAPPRPNLLLITVDQWRGDLAGEGPRAFARTPNLDALAREGTRFTRHFTQAYPCGPARAGLVTGLYAHKHRSIANGTPLDSRHPTLFTELRRAGYRPTLFGYTDTTLDPRGKAPLDPDRGDYENVCPGMVVDTLLTERATPWLAHLRRKGYPVTDPDQGRDGIFAARGFGEPALFDAADSETAFLTDRFLAWLGVAPSGFCAHLSFIAPHPPFAAAAPFHNCVDPADVPMPVRGGSPDHEAAQSALLSALFDKMDMGHFAPGLSGLSCAAGEATIRKVRALYAGLAQEVDHHIGRILAALRDTGLWDYTIVVFTGDHGEQLFDHWMLGKAGYFDQSAHIPLIIRDPRPAADGGRGRTVSAFTESIDLMPTLLDRVGLTPPRNADGRSLLPFCAGEAAPADWRDAVHWSFDFRGLRHARNASLARLPAEWCNLQVVRTERLKYVHFAGLPPVLFDLADDPDELVDRAADPGAAALRLEGLDRLATFRQRFEERTLTGMLCQGGRFQDADEV